MWFNLDTASFALLYIPSGSVENQSRELDFDLLQVNPQGLPYLVYIADEPLLLESLATDTVTIRHTASNNSAVKAVTLNLIVSSNLITLFLKSYQHLLQKQRAALVAATEYQCSLRECFISDLKQVTLAPVANQIKTHYSSHLQFAAIDPAIDQQAGTELKQVVINAKEEYAQKIVKDKFGVNPNLTSLLRGYLFKHRHGFRGGFRVAKLCVELNEKGYSATLATIRDLLQDQKHRGNYDEISFKTLLMEHLNLYFSGNILGILQQSKLPAEEFQAKLQEQLNFLDCLELTSAPQWEQLSPTHAHVVAQLGAT